MLYTRKIKCDWAVQITTRIEWGRIGTSFDDAKVVLLDSAYCKLERQGRNKGRS